jgi:hypothetical protein
MKLEFSRQTFENKSLISNYNKIRPVGANLFHADRRTDKTKRNFVDAPKSAHGQIRLFGQPPPPFVLLPSNFHFQEMRAIIECHKKQENDEKSWWTSIRSHNAEYYFITLVPLNILDGF